jgi:trans-aconitate 2-methyltransferase
MSWSPAQYTKFERERNRPVLDLLAQIPNTAVSRAVDIGCGPGNSTELLRARFPGAVVSGMDSSAEMIEAARKRLPEVPFEVDDISSWQNPGPFDVIFSNAVLQWVPDHQSLLTALIAKLAPRGSLAVQIPDNLAEPSHRLMREIATDGPWAGKLAGAAESHAHRHGAEWYYRILKDLGTEVNLWRTTYYHPLDGGANAIVEWFKSTGLRPFLAPLAEVEQTEFLARYEAAVAKAYLALPDGTILLPFPRLFFIATC